MIEILVLIAVLATSVLSGVLGMAGGMILMAVLVSVLPVAVAMVVHGAAQAASNGARTLFLRQHVMWRVVPPYLVGGTFATAFFVLISFVPAPGLVLILVGVSPWLARLTPFLRGLDIRNRVTGVACGAIVTAAQLLAGASGPLLDAFYLNTDVNPKRIVATKAVTQTIGHLVKVVYYGGVAERSIDSGTLQGSAGLIAGAILLAVVGARIGTALLSRLDARRFHRITTVTILALGLLCALKGVRDLVAG